MLLGCSLNGWLVIKHLTSSWAGSTKFCCECISLSWYLNEDEFVPDCANMHKFILTPCCSISSGKSHKRTGKSFYLSSSCLSTDEYSKVTTSVYLSNFIYLLLQRYCQLCSNRNNASLLLNCSVCSVSSVLLKSQKLFYIICLLEDQFLVLQFEKKLQ